VVVYREVEDMRVPFVLYRLLEAALMLPWFDPPRVLVLVFALVCALRPVEAAE
jgi:hypothetical protein